MSVFRVYTRKARQTVRFIVTDMSPQFRLVMETLFPQARIVCDRYQICRNGQGIIRKYKETHAGKVYTRNYGETYI